jgi:primosomal protein N' (replication factor Y) (superfamily II helicase)
MRIARVLPDVSGLDKQFDYLVPEPMVSRVEVGTIVRISLAGRRVGGWVIGVRDEVTDDGEAIGMDETWPAPAVRPQVLKPLAKVTGRGPSPEVVELAQWAAHRWAGRWRSVLTTASPPAAVGALGPVRRHAVSDVVASPAAATQLVAGGGVLRVPPTADAVAIVGAALQLGPTLVITPTIDMAREIGGRLRKLGIVPALAGRDWTQAASGVDVVIGARSAVFATAPGLRSIVVLDEHDEALHEERNPTWQARDVAIERAARLGIPCLLVSPAPTPAALAWAGVHLSEPDRQHERAGWPIIEPVDRSAEEPWVTSLVTPRLIAALRNHSLRVVCVLNTKGRARRLACRTCRQLTVCEHCAAAVGQQSDGLLRCPRCSTQRPVVCQQCGGSGLALLRPGVTRLREELQAAAGRRVVEVTGTSDPLDTSAAEGSESGVFVGTEAVLHRVGRADVVAFLDFDDELRSPRYRAAEQALGLVIRAARLVGPRAGGGRILVQTREPDHPVIDALVKADPSAVIESEMALRRLLHFPPYAALAVVGGTGAGEFADLLRSDLRLNVSGPSNGHYLVRAATSEALADALADCPRPPKSKIRVEVDPPRV